MENIKRINKYLEQIYGRALDNKPKFRVVWSNELTEVRHGSFDRYTESGIYLGSHEGIQRAPKYTYIRDKYVLEVYTRAFPEVFGGSIVHSTDIVKEGDFYEPLRVFRTKNNEYLPPREDVCKIVCDSFIELINRPNSQRLTRTINDNNDERDMKAEIAKFESILQMDDSDLLGKIRNKEAIFLPGKDIS